jgi:hypothetical protein
VIETASTSAASACSTCSTRSTQQKPAENLGVSTSGQGTRAAVPMGSTCSSGLDFAAINAAALHELPMLLARWLPDGRAVGRVLSQEMINAGTAMAAICTCSLLMIQFTVRSQPVTPATGMRQLPLKPDARTGIELPVLAVARLFVRAFRPPATGPPA